MAGKKKKKAKRKKPTPSMLGTGFAAQAARKAEARRKKLEKMLSSI